MCLGCGVYLFFFFFQLKVQTLKEHLQKYPRTPRNNIATSVWLRFCLWGVDLDHLWQQSRCLCLKLLTLDFVWNDIADTDYDNFFDLFCSRKNLQWQVSYTVTGEEDKRQIFTCLFILKLQLGLVGEYFKEGDFDELEGKLTNHRSF